MWLSCLAALKSENGTEKNIQTRGLISLVSDVDNNLESISEYLYYGSIVNNRPKNGLFCIQERVAGAL